MEQQYTISAFEHSNSILDRIKLLYARKFIYDDNWHSNMHTHNHSEFFYFISGAGSFQFTSHSCVINPGDFLIVNSNVPHTEISDKIKPMEYIVLGIDGIETLYNSNMNNEFVILQRKESKEFLYPLMNCLVAEYNSEKENSKLISDYILKSIILYILRQTKLVSAPSQLGETSSKECAEIRRYIDAHHKDNISLDELADYAHISKYYMVHAFKKAYGMSPINYLQHRRIAESKRLLQETTMPTSQIAHVLGFSSASHFSQCFKRLTFSTPSEFRNITNKNKLI